MSKNNHWYRQDKISGKWEACYQIPMKTKQGMRPPTIDDARKLGLVPSVTSITGVYNKSDLIDWRIRQAIYACMKLDRLENETDERYVDRVMEEADSISANARTFGTRIHDEIEGYLCEPPFAGFEVSKDLEPYLAGFKEWAKTNIEEVYAAEEVVGNAAFGYAGRLDLRCRLVDVGNAVVDFKTCRLKSNKSGKIVPNYPEWLWQLAAYEHCFETQHFTLLNVVIDSGEPGPVHVVRHQNASEGWECFRHCLHIWKHVNRYP